jgi:glycosyl transferase family 87
VSAALQRRSLRARAPEVARLCRRVLVVFLFGVLPASLLLAILVGSFKSGTGAWAIDFDGNFLRPAHEILRGVSPYHPAELEHVRRAVADGHRPDEFHDGVFPAYPAPALLLGVPFSYLPLGLAEWIWAGCMLLAGGLALRLVGVRDWRVYGIALLTPAAMSSVLLGAVDFALMLGIAACWRWRDHAGRAGLALGAIVALKLVAAPLVAWLLVTRRWRAAATAGAVALGLWLAGWAAIGFHGLSGYPHVLSLLTDIESDRGYSAVAYANLIGISGQVASLAPYVVGAGLLWVLWNVSKRSQGADEAAFLVGVLLLLAVSPIVWHHYFVLLFVPLAIYCPRFAPIWLVPTLCWVVWRGAFFYTGPAERLVFLAVIAGICAWMLTRTRPADGANASTASHGTLPAWR